MRSPSLTRTKSYTNDGRLCHAYVFDGETYYVCDSAHTMLLVIELFADEDLLERDKQHILLSLIFPNPTETLERVGEARFARFLGDILWEACGLDVSGDKAHHEEKIFDWTQDAARIKASFLKAYGLSWDEASRGLSFSETCALLGELLEDETSTPFQQAIYYRTADRPDFGKGNEKARRAWDAAKRHFQLSSEADSSRADAITAANNTSTDLFSALRTVAVSEGGGA